MNVRFSFLSVSLDQDGCISHLGGIDELISETSLALSWFSVQMINKMTNGIFLELWRGVPSRRYVLLEFRRQHIEDIKEMMPRIPEGCSGQQKLKRQLHNLINNAEACLEEHGANAAMLVH